MIYLREILFKYLVVMIYVLRNKDGCIFTEIDDNS